MLNDYGKSLLKPWLSVQNVVWLIALTFVIFLVIRTNDMKSSDIASWVQAIGSIAAIIGALAVSRAQVSAQNALAFGQIQHQIEMKSESDLRRAEAFLAVVGCAAKTCDAIYVTTEKDKSIVGLKGGWSSHMREVCQASLAALRNLPVHDLGSYELVVAHGTVLAAFVEFVAEVDLVVNDERSVKVPESHGILGGIKFQNDLLQGGFAVFEKAHVDRYGPLREHQ